MSNLHIIGHFWLTLAKEYFYLRKSTNIVNYNLSTVSWYPVSVHRSYKF